MQDGHPLLTEYARTGSETAFRELVGRYLDLVYSAAVRLVDGDTHLAEDVAQTVFADLARMARSLSSDVMLGGWLHRHTCFVARNILRRERRRQLRERQAAEMNASEDHSAANLALLAPVLDDAINQLGSEDRAAILLRFFEQQNFESVGQALGTNEEAARKRVNRAVDKLHGLLRRRGVSIPAAMVATTLGAQAVTAAPAGIALSISTAALTTAASGGGTALTLLKLMSMTKLKVGLVTGVVMVAVVSIPVALQHREQTRLQEENATLRQDVARTDLLAQENARLSNLLAAATQSQRPAVDTSSELLRLRGEVGRLRHENAAATAAAGEPQPSPLSGLRADPETWNLIRQQQKAGMSILYKAFSRRTGLDEKKTEQLTDVLAENVMENIDLVTAALRDGLTPEAADQLFAAQEAALLAKLAAEFGPEVSAQYQDYTHSLASLLTAEQMKGQLSGETAEREAKAKQIGELVQQEVDRAITAAGLRSDYQVIPNLNFRNIAFEQSAEASLHLLDNVYEQVIARSASFLTPEELKKFNEYRTAALSNVRASLVVNRKMMAPVALRAQ